MSGIAIHPATTRAQLDALVELFVEYQRWLDVDLGFQDFEQELTSLPGEYAPLRGALLIAEVAGAGVIAGAVGVRPLDGAVGELKRLYVRPAWRRRGLGRRLAIAAIDAARAAGYARLRLDTLAGLTAGLELYRGLGFVAIPPYRYNPLPDVVYLELDLRLARRAGR